MSEQLTMAEHQLLGFFHAKQGYSLSDLVNGMGLKESEFNELYESGCLSNISFEDILEIKDMVKDK